jgi:hypothetical protein
MVRLLARQHVSGAISAATAALFAHCVQAARRVADRRIASSAQAATCCRFRSPDTPARTAPL